MGLRVGVCFDLDGGNVSTGRGAETFDNPG
jgi:hypothetical protein